MSNLLDHLFATLAVFLLTTGILVNYCEKTTPKYLLKLWGYGSFSYNGIDMKWIELPKSYFRHFYVYATTTCIFSFFYMVGLYSAQDWSVFDFVYSTLQMLMGHVEPVSVSTAILTMFLFTIHVTRRLCETFYLQVFAKTSKINILHYVLAFVHYTACVLMLVGYAPLFTGSQHRDSIEWTDSKPCLTLPFVALFVFASVEQNRSNVILANLRKDRKGKVVTEKYNIPQGGLFDYVSSPHRLTEVIIYGCLCVLHGSFTSFLAFIWVFLNQTQISIKVHSWYLKEFDNYPKDRKAMIPFIL